MSETLIYLTYLGVILLIGVLCSVVSTKIKIPNVLLLILAGIGLKNIYYQGSPLIDLPVVFLTSIGVLALVMIIFDSTSRFNIKEVDTLSMSAFKLVIVFLIATMSLLTFATHYIYNVPVFLALLFGSLMAGTAPDVVLSVVQASKNKVLEILELEAIMNTPIVVLLPFIIIDFMSSVETEVGISRFMEQIVPFLQQIVAGIGAGVLVGIIFLKVMRKQYSERISPLAIIVAALLTYVLAENLDGNGVLAVTTMGLMFGNVYVKEKGSLQEFSFMFSNALEILVYVLVGFMIKIPLTLRFFATSLLLFVIYLGVRFIAVNLAFRSGYNLREKIFMTLNSPKGIAIVVVVFLLSTYEVLGIGRILDLILVFVLYSIILSSIVAKFSRYFIKTAVIK